MTVQIDRLPLPSCSRQQDSTELRCPIEEEDDDVVVVPREVEVVLDDDAGKKLRALQKKSSQHGTKVV